MHLRHKKINKEWVQILTEDDSFPPLGTNLTLPAEFLCRVCHRFCAKWMVTFVAPTANQHFFLGYSFPAKFKFFFMFFLFFIIPHLQPMSQSFKLIPKLRTSCMFNYGCKQERFPNKFSQCSTPWYMWVAGWPLGNSERCFVYHI